MRFFTRFLCILILITLVNGEVRFQTQKDNETKYPFDCTLCNETFEPVRSVEELDNIFEKSFKGSCLSNVTRCMEEDGNYEQTMEKVSKHLYASTPPLDFTYHTNISKECKNSAKKYIEDLRKYKFWALQMYDSTAKLSSGILSGNVNQFGDFDLCLSSKSEIEDAEEKVMGKYCLASFQVDTPTNLYLQGIHKLVQSHFAFRSTLDDPGHRVPRFSSINWGFCIPHTCSNKDLEILLKDKINDLFYDTDIKIQLRVDEEMCQTAEEKEIPTSTIIVGIFFASMFLLVFAATLYDFVNLENKNQILMTFSLRKNFSSMMSLSRPSNDLQAVHGIRCLNAVMLLLAHKSMALFFVPYVNRTEMSEFFGQPWTVLGRAASLYTDPFIMISGTLTAYSLLGRLQKTGQINILQEYLSRLLRIVPTFGALILFCTFILPILGNGPLWNLVVTHHTTICKQNWWRNMLFIHNYFGFKDMCLTHTHHVGIDTQLFFLSPFLVLILFKWPKKGAALLAALATISTIMRYYVTYTRELSNYVHFGTSVKQLFDTADYMYILPPHRLTVYIMGIFLAFILRYSKHINLKPIHVHIGNALAFLCFCISFFGPAFMGDINYIYKPIDGAMYAAFAPILWCFSFAWIIFTTHFGYKGIDAGLVGKLFSRPIFLWWTKISYTVYLTQFPIYFFNVGTTREAKHFGFFTMMVNLQEYSWVIFLSMVLTLVFETPFQNIRNVIFQKAKDKVKTN